MVTQRKLVAVRVAEGAGVVLLLWSSAAALAERAAPLPFWATGGLAVAGTAITLIVGRTLWMATVPATTAAARAAPPTFSGMVRRVAAHGPTPFTEFISALATPLALALAAGAFALASLHFQQSGTAEAAALQQISSLLVLFAAITLAPGLPFDGGRVVRALVWWWSGDVAMATRFAASAGQGLATLIVLAGVAVGLAGDLLTGAALVTLGGTVHLAASEGCATLDAVERVRGRRVRDAMQPPVATLGRGTSIAEALERYDVMGGPPVFPVLEGRRLAGVVTLDQAHGIPASRRPDVTAEEVMTTVRDLAPAHPDSWLAQAVGWPARARGYLTVVQGEQLLGIVLTDGAWPENLDTTTPPAKWAA